jgi:mono/diheme cytochrome c family protein
MEIVPKKHLILLAAALMSSPLAGAADRVDFVRDIGPILQEACVQCHGPDKQKGKFRLDTKESFLRGGEAGPAITPAHPDKSDLFRRVILAEDDEDVMPPKGKGDRLTAAQIDLVKRWISEGAAWPDGVVVRAETMAAGLRSAGPAPSPSELKAIAELAKHGVNVRPIAAGIHWRRATFRGAADRIPVEALRLLGRLTSLAELDLGNVQIGDGDLANIAGLKNLTVLHLEGTSVTDAGLPHLGKMEGLIYLNLFGTAVTDAGLKSLAGMKNLKSLYLAGTKVTPEGIGELKRNLPGVRIDDGAELRDLARNDPPAPVKAPDTAKPEAKKEPDPVKKPVPAEPAKPPAPLAPDAGKKQAGLSLRSGRSG